MRVELIPKRMSYRHRVMVLLVDAVSFLANNLTYMLILESFIDGYMLIASTDAIITLSLFIFSSSSLSYRLDAWTV